MDHPSPPLLNTKITTRSIVMGGKDRNAIPVNMKFMIAWRLGNNTGCTEAKPVESGVVEGKRHFLVQNVSIGSTLRVALCSVVNNEVPVQLAAAKILLKSGFRIGKPIESDLKLNKWKNYGSLDVFALVKLKLHLQYATPSTPSEQSVTTNYVNTFSSSVNSDDDGLSVERCISSLPSPRSFITQASLNKLSETQKLTNGLRQVKAASAMISDEVRRLEKEELELRGKISATQAMYTTAHCSYQAKAWDMAAISNNNREPDLKSTQDDMGILRYNLNTAKSERTKRDRDCECILL
eukprot:TRINITY_DN9513_c0_g1_i1.p1 TRINITY_DN9513_c0_g1~~TRINITY_DN9513_c0_g1_i1.p1  ORF type:complete len:295 (+),score=49.98 TRINITY_DN9513_c0_g1_i1:199-1083(+)